MKTRGFPFNDETQVPPRPTPTINQPQEEVPQQVAPQYIQHPYMEMMPPHPQEDKGWVTQIQQNTNFNGSYHIWNGTFIRIYDDEPTSDHIKWIGHLRRRSDVPT